MGSLLPYNVLQALNIEEPKTGEYLSLLWSWDKYLLSVTSIFILFCHSFVHFKYYYVDKNLIRHLLFVDDLLLLFKHFFIVELQSWCFFLLDDDSQSSACSLAPPLGEQNDDSASREQLVQSVTLMHSVADQDSQSDNSKPHLFTT